ncbi:hypothetical protein BaRGS_00010344 [Batillaria attramentaria]|uniref:DAGKc domain-containing protein n=1 Tax=Batillaria attramentaria TaxID=370345 RepID=A0ABD0LG57_9CAEN
MDGGSYTFDDEGNPVPAEKPPPAPRASRSKSKTSVVSATSQHSRTSSLAGAASLVSGGEATESDGDVLSDMFHMDGQGFDVSVSFLLDQVHWQPMNPSGRRKRSRSLSGLFKRRRSSSGLKDPSQNSVDLSKVFGARIKRRHKAGQSEDEGFVLGLGLFACEQKDANTLPISGRPKNVKVYLQPFAGERHAKSIYKHKIAPLFKTAGVAVDLTEINHNEHVKQDMIHLNLDDFDCIIAFGGDGTVHQVLNGLMNHTHKEQEIEMKPGFTPVKATVPLGIIPVGKTNHVACSVMGTADPVTAALHIIFGTFTPVDVCTVSTPEKFSQWAFNCQYGFAGSVLTFMKRYSSLGNKRIDAAFLKALTSSKLRSYECDIEYIPTPGVFSPTFNQVCRTGCSICQGSQPKDSQDVVTDMIEELDPLNNSGSSQASAGSVIELKQDSPWKTLKGSYMNISVFGIPGNCEIAPQGLSKFTHLNDGNIDLVIVKSCERKNFVRFLRRHGNSKNQFDFPFVEVIRCKEVRFRPRMPTSWSYNDHDFSEIKYQMNQLEKRQKQRNHRSMEVIDDLGRNQSLTPVGAPNFHYVGPQYRPTFFDQEITRRRRIQRKKEEKAKAREEAKGKSVWNIDNEICTLLELDIKVHCGLVRICGRGMSPQTEFSDVRFGCLPA